MGGVSGGWKSGSGVGVLRLGDSLSSSPVGNTGRSPEGLPFDGPYSGWPGSSSSPEETGASSPAFKQTHNSGESALAFNSAGVRNNAPCSCDSGLE